MSEAKAIDLPSSAGDSVTAIGAAPFEARAFVPGRLLRNGHMQTIFGNFLPRADNLPAPVPVLVEVSSASDTQIATQVLCQCHWQPAEVRRERPAVILVHGLEG